MATPQMSFSVLIKKDGDDWVAHCLELDIVAAANTFEQARSDVFDLIVSQIDYALANDNLEHLFKPAPERIWREFFSCRKTEIITREFHSRYATHKPVPSSITATTCSPELCYAS